MCTIIAMLGRRDGSLVVAANRDEMYARAASPPRVVHGADGPVTAIAGVDLAKGGTWMGANDRGIFVGITNQRQPPAARRGARAVEQGEPGLVSRGAVVLGALGEADVAGVDRFLSSLDARTFGSFNLLYGDAETLRVAYGRAERAAVEIHTLGEGLWVLPNDRIDSPVSPKTDRVRALFEPLADVSFDALVEPVRAALADHDEAPLERVPVPPEGAMFDHRTAQRLTAVCIHTPIYGTRSATLMELSPGRVERYLFADGPPCVTPFEDVTALLSP